MAELENVDRPLPDNVTFCSRWLHTESSVPLARWRCKEDVLELVAEDGTVFATIKVDNQMLSTRMGGHSVVDSWLELRRRPSLNRDFCSDHLSELVDLLERLRRRNALIEKIDEQVAQVMKADFLPHRVASRPRDSEPLRGGIGPTSCLLGGDGSAHALLAHLIHRPRARPAPDPLAQGLRYLVDAPLPVRGAPRRADLLFRGARVAVFVDGCFWHACPEHGTSPKANSWYWAPKLARNEERDRDTDRRLAEAGWSAVRVWEHEDPEGRPGGWSGRCGGGPGGEGGHPEMVAEVGVWEIARFGMGSISSRHPKRAD